MNAFSSLIFLVLFSQTHAVFGFAQGNQEPQEEVYLEEQQEFDPNEEAAPEDFEQPFDEENGDPQQDARVEQPRGLYDPETPTSQFTIDIFRALIQKTKEIVIPRLQKKVEEKESERTSNLFAWVFRLSFLGFLLLLLPLFLLRKYPGKGLTLLKYSAVSAISFFVIFNLYGGIFIAVKGFAWMIQPHPTITIANATFDVLDENAEEYIDVARTLFIPTLEQLESSESEPAVLLFENAEHIVEKGKVFWSIAKLLKNAVNLFGFLPWALFALVFFLLIRSILPNLKEIIELPVHEIEGDTSAVKKMFKHSFRTVFGELMAGLMTIFIIFIVMMFLEFSLLILALPTLKTLLGYFISSITYFQVAPTADPNIVYYTFFIVILSLGISMATTILCASFYIGQFHQIMEKKFEQKIPLSKNKSFFKWGTVSALLAFMFPLLYVFIAELLREVINQMILSGAEISWSAYFLVAPIILFLGYFFLFWVMRGFRAVKFLATYKQAGLEITPEIKKEG